jgi:hypothetical protein
LGSANFKVLSSTGTANGFSVPSSSSLVNLGVALGVSIPLLLCGNFPIYSVVIFIVAVKHKLDEDDKTRVKDPKSVTIPPTNENGT